MPVAKRRTVAVGGKLKRQTAVQKLAAAVRKASVGKKRASSMLTTKAEAASIARNEALRLLDTKYFHTNPYNWIPHQSMATPAAGAAANQNRRYQVSCVGFSSTIATEAMDPTSTTSMLYPTYGNIAIHPLECLRPMRNTNLNTIDTHFVIPTKAETVFTVARQPADLTNYGLPANSSGLQEGWQNSLPIRVRVIRVTPKISPGVSTDIDPKNDLFLDNYGEPFGVDTDAGAVGTDIKGMNPDFLRSQPVNNLKYHVLNDRQFVLGSPGTVSNNIGFTNENTNSMRTCNFVTYDGKTSAVVRFKHQLTTKKDGKVKFEKHRTDPTANPPIASDGQRREYIFFHFMWDVGVATFLPIDNGNYSGSSFKPIPPPLDVVRIVATPTSTFKDG